MREKVDSKGKKDGKEDAKATKKDDKEAAIKRLSSVWHNHIRSQLQPDSFSPSALEKLS